jgi:arylsulfatase A-like enzyme
MCCATGSLSGAVRALTVVLAFALGCGDPAPERIILIVVDTLRRDHLSPYDPEMETPNIQRLADRGQVFTNYVASFHQTTMSMGALFTGLTPSMESDDPKQVLPWTGRNWCGLRRYSAGPGDSCVPQDLATLAEALQRAGWFTVGVVANALLFAPSGFELGFDEWVEVGGADTSSLRSEDVPTQRAAPLVLEALRGTFASLPHQPLFLYVHYVDVHDWTYGDSTYVESVARMDLEIGRLLDALEAEGLLENATVILTSDHGEALGEPHPLKTTRTHLGNPSFQSVLEIPLIVAPPIAAPADRMFRSQDLAAVIEGAAGILGRAALSPEQGGLADDELLLSEDHYLTYRQGRWKSMFHRTLPKRWALFDLTADPGETEDRMAAEPAIVERHLKRIQALNASLGTASTTDDEQTEEDRARLRALGYLADEPETH